MTSTRFANKLLHTLLPLLPTPAPPISINFPYVVHKLTRNGHLSSVKANFHLMLRRIMKIFIALIEAIKIFEYSNSWRKEEAWQSRRSCIPCLLYSTQRELRMHQTRQKYTQVYLSLTLLFHNFKLAPKTISMATKKSNLYASNNNKKQKKKKKEKKNWEEHRKSCKRNEKFKTYKILNWLFN